MAERIGQLATGCQLRSKNGSSSNLVNQYWHFAGGRVWGRSGIGSGDSAQLAMRQGTLLPEVFEVVLDRLQVYSRDRILRLLRSAGTDGSCPVCQRQSDLIHSWYRRRLRDLRWEGIPVRIELHVRRFFCDWDGCPERTFTERLPKTALRYARRTSRLSLALEQITLALGGSAGSRLAEQPGILASDSTVLRKLRRKTIDTAIPPRVLCVDDWAWRKG